MDEIKAAELMPNMARRVLKLKTNAAFTQEMKEKAQAEMLSQAGQLKEINRLVNRTINLAKQGESGESLSNIYNKIISPKLNKYGSEFLPSGAASEMGDEYFEKIVGAFRTNKVKQASINAQKVYSENKDKRNYLTGQIGIVQRQLIGKAEEAIRSASRGLSNEDFEKTVREYYPKYFE